MTGVCQVCVSETEDLIEVYESAWLCTKCLLIALYKMNDFNGT